MRLGQGVFLSSNFKYQLILNDEALIRYGSRWQPDCHSPLDRLLTKGI